MNQPTAKATLFLLEKIVKRGICFPKDVLTIQALVLNAVARLRNEEEELEIPKVNIKLEEPKRHPKEALKCYVGKPGCADCMTLEEVD